MPIVEVSALDGEEILQAFGQFCHAIEKGTCDDAMRVLAKLRESCPTFAFSGFINFQIESGDCPLHLAVATGDLDKVELVLEWGGYIDMPGKKGKQPIHVAAELGLDQVVRFLSFQGADIDARDCDHNTPLHLSANNGHLNVVWQFIQLSDDINSCNAAGKTPTGLALESHHDRSKSLLIANDGKVSRDSLAIDGDKPWLPMSISEKLGYEKARYRLCSVLDFGEKKS
ncbi:MAG: ankyrin repeat protein [Candidatus Marinamargulisbacteria bacterium]